MRAWLSSVLFASVSIGGCSVSESTTSDDSSALASARTVHLTDGSVVRGVPVAAYRHEAWWWDASPEVTYAFFDPGAFSAQPGADRSLRFVDGSQIRPGQAPMVVPSKPPSAFRTWARGSGITLHALPLRGVANVLNGNERYHLQEGGFGDFAWDFVTTFEDGVPYHGEGRFVTDYAVWDAPVYLPTGGWVVDVDDSAPDNAPGSIPPGPMQSIKNNMIGLQVAGSYYVYLLHFRQGSIPRASRGSCEPSVPGVACIEPGTYLPAGTYLGRVGNSGVTYEPHLHVAAYFWDTGRQPVRSWSVPIDFEALHVRRPPQTAATLQHWVVPATGDVVSNDAF